MTYLPVRKPYDFFDELFKAPVFGSFDQTTKLMKTDIKEMKDAFVIKMELPGFAKEDIKAELKDGYLNVSATRTSDKESSDENGKFLRKERFEGTCKRSFYVGDYLNEEDIQAAYKDGVLDLTFPKEPESVPEEPKYISIN